MLTSGIVVTGAGGTVALLGGCDKTKEIEVEEVYNFLDHLDEAEIVAPEKACVQKSAFPIAGEEREVLFEHPDARVTFKDVAIMSKARLSFGIGINEAAWDKGGDGVHFSITLIDQGGGRHDLYSRYLDPKNNPEDRQWFDEALDLKDFAGQSVSITFETSSGPKNDNTFDWAGWSEPQISFAQKKRIKQVEHTNVILITLDTTRADHVSSYGYTRKTTPNLDKLAAKSLQFLNAISPSPWTIPAHASLFTSLFPSQHGAITKMEGDVLSGYPLRQFDFVLARLLKKHGLFTAGFVGGPFLKSEFGFSQGFDIYEDTWEGFDQRANQINAKVFPWLEKNASAPFFLFINYFDPHAPYNPPSSFHSPFKGPYDGDVDFSTFGPHQIMLGEVSPLNEQNKQRAIDLYDSEILYMDHHLGKLLDRLEAFGVLDNSLMIITSDHGESFGEHEIWGHGGLPVESQIRVPLIIQYPPKIKKPRRIADQIQTTSIFSTILKNLDIPLPPVTEHKGFGIDLLSVGEGERNQPPEYTFAERFIPSEYRGMLRSNHWKYLQKTIDRDNGKEILEWVFDLKHDPYELTNLLGRDTKKDDSLRSAFSQFVKEIAHEGSELRKLPAAPPKELGEGMRESLKALGYVK